MALTVVLGCGKWADKLTCGENGCEWTADEWTHVRSLAFICSPEQRSDPTMPCGDPVPPDPSNQYLPIADWTSGALKADPASDPFVSLGRRLYFDTRLSGTATWKDTLGRSSPSARAPLDKPVNLSCASCHDPARFGADFTSVPRTVAIGAGWYDVNGQSTLNAARFRWLYWNGRSDSLWAQAAQVMESPVSMNGHRMKTFWTMVKHYPDDLGIFPEAPPPEAFPEDDPAKCPSVPPAWSALAQSLTPLPEATATTADYRKQYSALCRSEKRTVTFVHVNVAKAIAAYEWLLSSDRSDFDRFANEGWESTALTPAAKRGLKLFVGKGSCIDCHSSPLLSDGYFHNIGVPQAGTAVPTVEECSGTQSAPLCDCVTMEGYCLPWGAFAGRDRLAKPPPIKPNPNKPNPNEFGRWSIYSFDSSAEAAPAPPDLALKGAWRTPSLRNVAMTGPYMHDGLYETLADVVWHYDQAGATGASGVTVGKSELSRLSLSAGEREDLVAFLSSLTGKPRAGISSPPDTDGGAADAGEPPVVDAGPWDGGSLDAAGSADGDSSSGAGGQGP